MDLGITGKRALVCASSKGLGRGCAEALAEAGVELVLNARGAEALDKTAQEIRDRYGVKVTAIAADITDAEDRARVLEERVIAESGRDQQRDIWELKLLDERMSIINAALFLAVLSAVMACIVIAMLFVANIARLHIGTGIAFCFIVAVTLLTCCLAAFMWEVRVSLRAIHVRKEILS